MYINESVSTDFAKKNKTLISKLSKYIKDSAVSIDDKYGSVPNLYKNGTCVVSIPETHFFIEHALKLLFPDLVFRCSDYCPTNLYAKVWGDYSIITYSKNGYMWVGVEFKNLRPEIYGWEVKGDFGEYMLMHTLSQCIGSVDTTKNDEFYKEVEDLTGIDLREYGRFSGQKDVYRAEQELKKFIDKYGNKYEKVFKDFISERSSRLDLKTVLDSEYFPKCDKRENFVPVVEINISEGKAFLYKAAHYITINPNKSGKYFADVDNMLSDREFVNNITMIHKFKSLGMPTRDNPWKV